MRFFLPLRRMLSSYAMGLFKEGVHRKIFFASLALSLASLPFSEYALSIGVISLSVNWILEGGIKRKVKMLAKRRSALLFMLIYFSLLVGMFYTSNFAYGLSELRLKLPLLFLPLVLATSTPVNGRELFYLLTIFVISVLVASFYSSFLFFQTFYFGGANVREISPFVSHIRFGLMVNIAFFICVFYLVKPPLFMKGMARSVFIVVLVWLLFFILILQSLTAVVVLVSTVLFLLFLSVFFVQNIVGRFAIFVFLCCSVLFVASFTAHQVDAYFTRQPFDESDLELETKNGNVYFHDPQKIQYENGYPVWINISWSELSNEWNRISNIPFSGKDRLGQPLNATLIRYLSSMGLTKDSVGISKLDKVDVGLIESGVTSIIFKQHRFGLYPRMYQFFWEIDQYLNIGQVNGSPFVQRFIYIKSAIALISEYFWFGVGTGDLADSFTEYYRLNEPNLHKPFWYLSHNQYLTQWVALGFFGFVFFLTGWFIPFFQEKRHTDFLAITFFFIITLSMFNEDTFQTHVGVCLASIFYSIAVFSKESNESIL
ncbi:MAG TPA: O-antigen ligase family protein [Tenuifilaceae bacterium]|nr:O-antigen ligase family protein [Tenuifilaceae bacterium]